MLYICGMEINLFLLACSYYHKNDGLSQVMKDGTIIQGFDVAMVHAEQTIELSKTQLPHMIDALAFYQRVIANPNWRAAYYIMLSPLLKCTYNKLNDSLMIVDEDEPGLVFFADNERVIVTKHTEKVYEAVIAEDTTPTDILNVIIKYFVTVT